MSEAGRLFVLLALGGSAFVAAGAGLAWIFHESRRVRGTLRKVLGQEPQLCLIAKGRGRGLGLNGPASHVAVVWDTGAWGLAYAIDELLGAELIVDRQVAARAHRGEMRRPLDQLAPPHERVRLRLLFDDPAYPDFDMDLWRPEDAARRDRFDADEALHEANRWIARLESLMRRRVGVGVAPAAVVAAPVVAFEPLESEAAEWREAIP